MGLPILHESHERFFDLNYCNKSIFIGFKRGVRIVQVTSGGGESRVAVIILF